EQLGAATVEGRFHVDRHSLELDALLLRTLVADDVGAGNQGSQQRLRRRRPHVGAFTLLGFIDRALDVADGNLRARVSRTVTMNALRDRGLLFYGNHDIFSYCSIGIGAHLIRTSLPGPPGLPTRASRRRSKRPIPASGTAPRRRPRSARWRSTD